VSQEPDIQVSVDDREASPAWHLRVVIVIIVVLAVAYKVAVSLVLK
jgi:hypothetical protein